MDALQDQATLDAMYDELEKSGMQTKLFIVDAKWEDGWGTLRHSEKRLPNFDQFLARIRADGKYVGLWCAFMRCEYPSDMGLSAENMLVRDNPMVNRFYTSASAATGATFWIPPNRRCKTCSAAAPRNSCGAINRIL